MHSSRVFRLAFFLLLFVSLAVSADTSNFTNGGFETGDYTGWTQGGGIWLSPQQPPDPAAYLPGGSGFDPLYMASSVLRAPVAADPRTDGRLAPIPSGANTAKINDETGNLSVSVISQTITGNNIGHVVFSWAAVLQASHGVADSDRFLVRLTDQNTGENLFLATYSSATAPLSGLFTQSSTGWFYTSWQTQDIDVTTRRGHAFTLTVLAADCPYADHAGYVYLSAAHTTALTSGPLTINSSSNLGTLNQGAPLSVTLNASGGLAPYTWKLAGAAPAGLTITPAGLVTGNTSIPGNYTFTAIVTDALGDTAQVTVTYSVLGLNTSTLPDIAQFFPYTAVVTVSGGAAPYTISASGLPSGLSISGDGTIQGTTPASGTFPVVITVTDSTGHTLTTSVSVTVIPPPVLSIVTVQTPDGQVNAAFSSKLSATGGVPPYAWALASGKVPDGLFLHSDGTIDGTPTAPGTSNPVVRLTDASGASVTGGVSIKIAPLPLTAGTSAELAKGYAGIAFGNAPFTASGGVQPYTYSIDSGSLPAGLTLAADGTLKGVPTTVGTANFVLKVTDAVGTVATTPSSLTILPLTTNLLLSGGSLSFQSVANSTKVPAAQAITVQSTTTDILTFSTAVSGADWLLVGSTGITPSSINVSLADSTLQFSPGSYQAVITVTCTAPSICAGASQTIAVQLTVAAAPPVLTVSSDLVSFTSVAGSTQSATQVLSLENTGGGSLAISQIVCRAPWCSVGGAPSAVTSGASSPLNVSANPSGLATGYYRTTLDVTASGGAYSVPVTLFVAEGPGITLQPFGVQLTSAAGGTGVGGQNFFNVVASAAGAGINWTASVLPGASWLSVDTASGTSTDQLPGTVRFSINQAALSLAAGTYYGQIRINAPGALNMPQDFEVVLNVTASGTPLPPSPTPQGLVFVSSGSTPPASQAVRVPAGGVTPVTFSASVTTTVGNWLSLSATSGTSLPSNPAQTLVQVDPTGLAPGAYYGGINFGYPDNAAVRTVNVTLIVTAPATAARNAGRLSPHADTPASCVPTAIVPAQIGLVNNFSAPASWPTPLSLQLFTDCGGILTNGQVVATFSNGDAPLALAIANPTTGLYSATWTPRHTASQVAITARASAPGLPTVTALLSGSVTPNSAPVFNPHSTLHVFDPEIGGGLGPGTIVQMYGSFLASQVVSAADIPLPTKLMGTSVLIGGIEAPLYFVSPGQINAQIPFELRPNQQYQIIVNANGALTTPDTVQLTPVSPGFAALADGTVIAQHVDGSLVTTQAPGKPGEYLVMYLAGLGLTDNPVTTGAASPSDPLARPTAPPALTIGSQPAAIAFAGLTPGLVGLYQINFAVPSGLPNGNLPIVLTQGGQTGNVAVLPVHN